MQRIKILLPFIFLLLCSFSNVSSHSVKTPLHTKASIEATVFICDSKSAVAYHSSSGCRGLGNCKHEVKEISKSDAINVYGRRACKICY